MSNSKKGFKINSGCAYGPDSGDGRTLPEPKEIQEAEARSQQRIKDILDEVDKESLETQKKEEFKYLSENGFSLYEVDDTFKYSKKEWFSDPGKWEEEKNEQLGFLLKKRVAEIKFPEGGKIVHIFVQVYPLRSDQELSEEAFKRIAEIQFAFERSVEEKYANEKKVSIIHVDTPNWTLEE